MFDIINTWLITIVGGIVVGIVLYYWADRRKKKKAKVEYINHLNKADNLLKLNRPEDALEEYKNLLEKVSVVDYQELHARIRSKMGICYFDLAKLNNKEKNLEDAIQAFEDALKVYTIENYHAYYYEIIISYMKEAKQKMRE